MSLSPDEAADRFGRLQATKDGNPVVVLLGDPDLSEGFLSVVQRGANARRFQVAKAELPNDELHPANVGTLATAEDQATAQGWLARVFGNVLGLFQASKGAPTSFEAAVGVPQFYDALYLADDGLWTVIGNILRDEEVLDKAAKLRAAIEAHAAFLIAAVDSIPTMKSETAREVAGLTVNAEAFAFLERAKASAAKVDRMIGTADRGRLNRAKAILEDVVARLEPSPGAALFPSLTLQEDDMNVQVAAKAAAETAVQAAKSAGVTDPVKLADIAVAASTEVFKAAVAGPPQPALHTDLLARQRAMSGGESGAGWGAEGALLSAINSGGGSMVMKAEVQKSAAGADVVKAVVIKAADGKEIRLSSDADALAWIIGRATKAQELEVVLYGDGTDENPGFLKATTDTFGNVAKALGIPEASAQGQGAEPTEPAPGEGKSPATKSDPVPDGEVFAGTGFLG